MAGGFTFATIDSTQCKKCQGSSSGPYPILFPLYLYLNINTVKDRISILQQTIGDDIVDKVVHIVLGGVFFFQKKKWNMVGVCRERERGGMWCDANNPSDSWL